ncbi:hypothetical protein SKAU_G00158300 [Synaphobranchus kaupii]|uniref:Uncharacterized protein n=1 Tax=Synaphobranchus kaupii TaxID=118154 RepID=A0A9Q1FI06_SYNKA|nr:hypothetical protein SKAU_G00158300 [Synaphobranchus kaupii]
MCCSNRWAGGGMEKRKYEHVDPIMGAHATGLQLENTGQSVSEVLVYNTELPGTSPHSLLLFNIAVSLSASLSRKPVGEPQRKRVAVLNGLPFAEDLNTLALLPTP